MDHFTADTHLGHGNIMKYCHRTEFMTVEEQEKLAYLDELQNRYKAERQRPHPSSSELLQLEQAIIENNFHVSRDSVDRMDAYLIDQINKQVGVNDILWHLGDFCAWRGNSIDLAKQYRDRIHCRNVNFIWGNHDAKLRAALKKSNANLFQRTYDLYDAKINGQGIVLCHYAMAVWVGNHRGNWHLYGHSHSTAEKGLDECFSKDRRSIDVGVDNAFHEIGTYRPFTFTELKKIMSTRKGVAINHHDQHRKNGNS